MKILFFASSSIHSIKWIKYFSRNGYEISWITFDTIDEKTRNEVGATVYSFDQSGNKILRFLKALVSVRRLVAQTRPDIIHVHYVGFYGVLARLQNQVPYICTAWGSDILFNKKNPLKRFMVKSILAKSQRVTCDA